MRFGSGPDLFRSCSGSRTLDLVRDLKSIESGHSQKGP